MTSTGAAAVVVISVILVLLVAPTSASAPSHVNDDGTYHVQATLNNTARRIPPSCNVVMAQSSIPNAGWGVFSLTDRRTGEAVLDGDVVIQVSDFNTTFAEHLWRITFDYAWNSQETGGQYEGIATMSIIPGLGMLANGSPTDFNVLPVLEPTTDGAGVTRHSSPAAGAFTHYHNYSFILTKSIKAGEEIMANYGPNWFQKRAHKLPHETTVAQKSDGKLYRATEALVQEGFCLDNLKPGTSTLPHAGRGAFVRRSLPKGSIVAPVPVLPITKRQALDVTRIQQLGPDPKTITTQNLLLNYCYGNANSSVLLFPYSPLVNLINHSPNRANVRLQWSSVNQQHTILSLEELYQINTDSTSSTGGLLLELVALTDIQEGDEIMMDYGAQWQAAWDHHLQQWRPSTAPYVPARILDDDTPVLATQDELKSSENSDGFPQNVITSCYYRYQQGNDDENVTSKSTNNGGPNITTTEWKYTKSIYELRNLRPCVVIQRFQTSYEAVLEDDPSSYYYTIIARNRYGLSSNERIPTGHLHVVTRVPRRAIRFTDKIYTTDQHIEGSFRQEIGLAEDLFPSQWIDLVI